MVGDVELADVERDAGGIGLGAQGVGPAGVAQGGDDVEPPTGKFDSGVHSHAA